MENEETQSQPMMTYVISAVLILIVLGGAWYFRSKTSPSQLSQTPPIQTDPVVMPTPGPITKLDCDKQYFNQKVGFNEYYLSVEGGDVSPAKNVSCEFVAKVKDNVVARANAEGPLSDSPQRGGSTFRCTTKAVAIDPNVVTTIEVKLTDDIKSSSSCSADFTFTSL